MAGNQMSTGQVVAMGVGAVALVAGSLWVGTQIQQNRTRQKVKRAIFAATGGGGPGPVVATAEMASDALTAAARTGATAVEGAYDAVTDTMRTVADTTGGLYGGVVGTIRGGMAAYVPPAQGSLACQQAPKCQSPINCQSAMRALTNKPTQHNNPYTWPLHERDDWSTAIPGVCYM